jgi:hypothetical protein
MCGKSGLTTPGSTNSRRNHLRIGACIHEASLALSAETNRPWALSRDWNYQMSNRFAWAWKLTELGYAVVLVYLGFLHAEEMRSASQSPFSTVEEWTNLVEDHSSTLVPRDIWNTQLTIQGQPFLPLIRATTYPLPAAAGEASI